MVNLAASWSVESELSLAPILSNSHRARALWRSIAAISWQKALGVVSALTILTAGSFAGTGFATEPPIAPSTPSSPISATSTRQQPSSTVDSGLLAEGMYLYGDSVQGGVVGHNYLIFQVTADHHVVGAAYAPYSSFDCFHGQERAMQLELILRDSYTQSQSATSIALSELKPISTIGITDQQLLNTCRADVSKTTEAIRPLSK